MALTVKGSRFFPSTSLRFMSYDLAGKLQSMPKGFDLAGRTGSVHNDYRLLLNYTEKYFAAG